MEQHVLISTTAPAFDGCVVCYIREYKGKATLWYDMGRHSTYFAFPKETGIACLLTVKGNSCQ